MASGLITVTLFAAIYQSTSQTVICSGDCNCPSAPSGTTCILNCYGNEQCKDSTLKCRSSDPCEVNCYGVDSCEGNAFIDGAQSTDVTINCVGDNACKGNTVLNCGTASCSILCGTGSSCQNTKVNVATATRFECIGNCGSFNIPAPFVIPTNPPTLPTNNPTKQPSNYPSSSPTKHPVITSLDPTASPIIKPIYSSSSNLSSTTTISATAADIPVSMDRSHPNRTAIIIIGILSLGIIVVSCGVLWLLCAKRKHVENFKVSRLENLKHDDLKQSALSDYGATQLKDVSPVTKLRLLHEDNQSTVSDIDNSRNIIGDDDGIETNDAYKYIDQLFKQAASNDNVHHNQYMRNPSYMYGMTSDNIPKIEYKPPIAMQNNDAEDDNEYSHVTVTTDALSTLKATGDLCSSSDNAEEEGSESPSCLSTEESEMNLDTACVPFDESKKDDTNHVHDDWLINELNDKEIDDVEHDTSTYIE